MSSSTYINRTKDWIAKFVVGLNLCPFAKHPLENGHIRYIVIPENDLTGIMNKILSEIDFLIDAPMHEVETTLIILPDVDLPFENFYDFGSIITDILEEHDYSDEVQLVAFHPQFRYERTDPEDVSNYTNRSPYPMMHLLRQLSIEAAANEFMGLEIATRNQETLTQLGKKKLDILLKQ